MKHFQSLRNALSNETPGYTFESDEHGEVPASVILETTGEALIAISETLSDAKEDITAIETEEQTAETATASLESLATAEIIAETLVDKGNTEEEALAIVAPAIEDAEINVDAEPGTLSDGTSLESATTEEGGAKKWWGTVKANAIKLYNLVVDALKRAKEYLVKLYEKYFDGATKLQKAADTIIGAASAVSSDRTGEISVSARVSFGGASGYEAIKKGVAATTTYLTERRSAMDATSKDLLAGIDKVVNEGADFTPPEKFETVKPAELIGGKTEGSDFKATTGEAKNVQPATRGQIKEIAKNVKVGAEKLYKDSKAASELVIKLSDMVNEKAKSLKDIKESEKAEDAKKKLKALTEIRRAGSTMIKALGSQSTSHVINSYQNALSFCRSSLATGK